MGGRAPLPSAMATRMVPRPVARSTAGETATTVPAQRIPASAATVRSARAPFAIRTRSDAVASDDQLQLAGIGDLDDRRRGRAVDQLAGAAQQADDDAGDRAAHGGALDLPPRPL